MKNTAPDHNGKQERKSDPYPKRALSLFLTAAALLSILASCVTAPSSGTASGTEKNSTDTALSGVPENSVETGNFEIDETGVLSSAKNHINLNNYLFRQQIPYLFVSLPEKSGTYGHAAAAALCEKLGENDYIGVLDLTDLDPGENAVDEAKAVYERIAGYLWKKHALCKSEAKDPYYFKPQEKTVAVTDKDGTKRDYTYLYTKYASMMTLARGFEKDSEKKTGRYSDCVVGFDKNAETVSEDEVYFGGVFETMRTTNRWGSGKAVVLHDLNDKALLAILSLCFEECCFIDLGQKGGNVGNDLRKALSGGADIVISLLDASKTYSAFVNGNYEVYPKNFSGTFLDNNGILQVTYAYTDPSVYLPRTLKLRDAAESSGAVFAFVQAPFKILEGVTKLPDGVTDGVNKTADDFLALLEKNKVNVFDIRKAMIDSGEDVSEWFLKTEHHWSHKGAFFGYRALLGYLRDTLGFDVDKNGYFSSADNYDVTEYINCMTSYYATPFRQSFVGLDGVTLIYPKKPMRIKLAYSSKTVRTGDFYEAIFDTSYLTNTDSELKKRYQCYLGNDTDMVVIENEDAECDKSILLIKDSFALPVAAWLSQNFKKVTLFDTRYMKTTATNYVKNNKFDLVAVMYNASIYNIAAAMYNF